MSRALAWLGLAAAPVLLGLAGWPFSGDCAGRWMELDCESRMVFAVNLFAPLGLLALICAIWTLTRRTATPHFILLAGMLAVLGWWIRHTI